MGNEKILDVAVVIPALDEERNLPLLLDRVVRSLGEAGLSFELIVVLDGGSDGSFEVLRSTLPAGRGGGRQGRPQGSELRPSLPKVGAATRQQTPSPGEAGDSPACAGEGSLEAPLEDRETMGDSAARAGEGRGRLVVVKLERTVGQHAALAEGLRRVTAPFVVTLDADLQNPPEAIPAIVEKLRSGADAVGTIRKDRNDSLGRKGASMLFRAAFAALRPRARISDPGCMLRGYRKEVVDEWLSQDGKAYYLPLQLGLHAKTYVEMETPHSARNSGDSRYGLAGLVRLFGRVVRGRLARWSLPQAAPVVAEVATGALAPAADGVSGPPVADAGKGGRGTVVVLGYGLVGRACLQAVVETGVRVAAVYTHSQGADRWQEGLESDAKRLAAPCFVDVDFSRPEEIELLKSFAPDVLLSLYYRDVLPAAALRAARLGGLNLHGSLLPAYRGRAPVNWMVLNGEEVGGATLHVMRRKPDSGPIVGRKEFSIEQRDTAYDVLLKVRDTGVELVRECLGPYLAGRIVPVQQEGPVSTFGRRTPEDGRIDWSLPARGIYNLVRAVTRPYPGAFADMPDGRRLRVWQAEEAPDAGPLEPGGMREETGEEAPQRPSGAGLLVGTGTVPLRVVEWEWEG